jgi:nucleoside phosphorylase
VPFLSFRMISDVHGSGQDATALYKDFWQKVADDSFAFLKLLIDKL